MNRSKKNPRKPIRRFPRRIVVPLKEGVAERLDDLRRDDETRLDLIREGIQRVLEERDK